MRVRLDSSSILKLSSLSCSTVFLNRTSYKLSSLSLMHAHTLVLFFILCTYNHGEFHGNGRTVLADWWQKLGQVGTTFPNL